MEPIAADQMTTDLYRGAFHALQRDQGATFYEDDGALWAASFGDPVAEYWSVRRGAGLWDTSGLTKIHVTGRDALPALDRLVTRRVVDSAPGRVRYGLLLDEQGLMLDDVTVLVISAEDAYLFVNYGEEDSLEHLSSASRGMRVRFENVTRDVPSFAVQGPRSFAVLDELIGADIASLGWFRCMPEPVEIAGARGMLVRAGFTGELGYEFFLLDGPRNAEDAWEAVLSRGASPVGMDAIEALRIEAGLVIAEEDYFPGVTDPLELGLERFVDLRDHDFIGRAALEGRLSSTRRRFMTLQLQQGEPPEHGTPVTRNDVVVGASAVPSGPPASAPWHSASSTRHTRFREVA